MQAKNKCTLDDPEHRSLSKRGVHSRLHFYPDNWVTEAAVLFVLERNAITAWAAGLAEGFHVFSKSLETGDYQIVARLW